MNPHSSIHSTIDGLVAAIDHGQDASVRVLKLLTQVFSHWSENKDRSELNTLTDAELLQEVAVSGALVGALNTREQRKKDRRIAAKISFLEDLKRFGGVLKSQGVANHLSCSRQTVNNYVKKGSLIALQDGNDYLYPSFQFVDEGKRIPHLEEVLGLLKDVSAEARCTFFLNPIAAPREGQDEELVFEILKRGATEDELKIIKRDAALYMTSTPS